ncbi:MAG: hypothetical protein JSV03_15405 [Planctomycetota bacterium]|nr:MAG: hypothetical protein JSV03_15405 [Planctomycetota bacterium]
MKSYKKALLFGLGVWLIPFAVSCFIFPLKSSDRALFESIMPVAVAVSTVFFAVLYMRRVGAGFIKEGMLLGIIWLVISLIIDLCLFMEGPMKRPFIDYIKDIGLTYMIIPAITTGFGLVLEGKRGTTDVVFSQ